MAYVFDYGALDPEIERQYIEAIVGRSLPHVLPDYRSDLATVLVFVPRA